MGSNKKLNSIYSATLQGVTARPIEVEASFTRGLPGFSLVGLASSDIQESKERVKASLITNGFTFPPLKITINLSPSDIKKSGTHFDLSIALLIALNKFNIEDRDIFVFGELGLDGKVKSSSMLFPIILSLKEQSLIKKALVPKESIEALSYIPDIKFIPVNNLSEAISIMMEIKDREEISGESFKKNRGKEISINGESYFYKNFYPDDFLNVKGQEIAKRASLIASAGMHNFLMEGSPGCGKSMIAKRVRWILPPVSEEEILSIAKHQFLDGETPTFEPFRPFRSPHHTATTASIFGGGSHTARIGEVALAHNGVLFFDELPHFQKRVLEALREPLQDRVVNISRVNSKISYDANFMFISAMNPCFCGNFLSKSSRCECSPKEIRRYKKRLSEPLLDRIDIFVVMQEVSAKDKESIDSLSMHQMVIEAFKFQKERGQKNLNGKLTEKEIEKYCKLNSEAENILFKAVSRFNLSHRAIVSIKKVARTVADLAKSEQINKKHLLEALNYRRR